MHSGRIQRVVTSANTQESGALLKGLGAQPGNLK
ncbi:Uncharacterised protein [Mycobacteroides abscessus subsp. abscessus]|nr:Uncharacterised protein [Mycobacteroides abscessus subsp. abscessus]